MISDSRLQIAKTKRPCLLAFAVLVLVTGHWSLAPALQACTRYWVGGGSSVNWNATANTNWGTASNIQDNASVPTTTDDVCFDGVGTGASNSTISANIEIKSLDMTGYANTLTHNAFTLTVNGLTFKLSSGMTYTTTSGSTVTFTSTSGTTQITTNGKSFRSLTLNGAGGTFQLQDNSTASALGTTTLTAGTFDLNGKMHVTGMFSTSNSNVRSLSAVSSTLVVAGSGNVFDALTATNLTLNFSSNGVLEITDGSTVTKTIRGSGLTFGDLVLSGGGSGTVILSSANTFNRIISVGHKFIQFPASATTTLTAVPVLSLATITSSSAGTAATMSLSSGNVCVDRSSIKDITATGGASFYAQNSTSVSGNTGMTFATCVATTGGQKAYGFVW